MKLGLCCSIDDAETAKAIGYDYFECNFAAMTQLDEPAYQAMAETVETIAFQPLAMNVMLSSGFRLTGEAADPEAARGFLVKGMARAARLGTQIVVFGSGGARNLPPDFHDRPRAYDQITDFARMAGSIAAEHGITIAIEPLSFREGNIVNLIGEAVYLADRVALPNVRVLADYYHMVGNRETAGILQGLAPWIAHCHIAQSPLRTYPSPDDGQDYRPLFRALNAGGYHGGISVEAGRPDPFVEKAQETLTYLKQLTAET
ncbi:MAG: sugar phosphate isomerase/epimerase [Eubacteriales bacterium]|nr:sugar phosphate isomerase/epimerase [Eubacteriales bacterium]